MVTSTADTSSFSHLASIPDSRWRLGISHIGKHSYFLRLLLKK